MIEAPKFAALFWYNYVGLKIQSNVAKTAFEGVLPQLLMSDPTVFKCLHLFFSQSNGGMKVTQDENPGCVTVCHSNFYCYDTLTVQVFNLKCTI